MMFSWPPYCHKQSCHQNLFHTYLFIHSSSYTVLRQLYKSSYSCKMPKQRTKSMGLCAESSERCVVYRVIHWCLLTSVAVVLSVALQLKVFVPCTQFFTAGQPHTQPLEHQQALTDTHSSTSYQQRKEIKHNQPRASVINYIFDQEEAIFFILDHNRQNLKVKYRIGALHCVSDKQ